MVEGEFFFSYDQYFDDEDGDDGELVVMVVMTIMTSRYHTIWLPKTTLLLMTMLKTILMTMMMTMMTMLTKKALNTTTTGAPLSRRPI